MLNKDLREFIALLNEHGVEYLVIGGYAVGYYGYPRYTGDIDLWVKMELANAQKALAAIKSFGFESLGLTKEDLLDPAPSKASASR